MSRRIVFGLLAAAALLTAAPAQADRECFENSCRMPDVVEPPPPQAVPAPAADEGARAEATPDAVASPAAPAPSENGAARAASPVGIYPQMVVDQGPRKQPKPAARRDVDIGPARFPARPAPRYSDGAPAPAAVARPATAAVPVEAPARLRARPIIVSAPAYGEGPAPAGAAVIGVPAEIYADDGVVAAYPDPSWKLCQISEGGAVVRYYRCGPYSYHPYGEHGYRPYGSYRAYRSAPGYVVAPNAKIISIETEN